MLGDADNNFPSHHPGLLAPGESDIHIPKGALGEQQQSRLASVWIVPDSES
jgi:hypothetical protein